MSLIWVVNQFANTPDLPGHTRQYEIAISLSKKNWKIKNIKQKPWRKQKNDFGKNKHQKHHQKNQNITKQKTTQQKQHHKNKGIK